MAKGPSCYLHLGLLMHIGAFGSLMAGYCTPYWTIVKMSTGNVRALGLVVSCDIEGCEMLHVTEARVVFIIVFGMATGCVLFSLFALQVFCLALYNGSCRQRNLGAGLSYFSLFLSFTMGGVLGLYQIDLEEEDQPDVMSIKIGWSRYAMIGSSGAFLLAAWLSVADFVRRHRLLRREILKKAEMKTRLITVSEQTRQQQQQHQGRPPGGNRTGPGLPQRGPPQQRPGVPQRQTGPPSNKWTTAAVRTSMQRRPRRMASTVQVAMKVDATEKRAKFIQSSGGQLTSGQTRTLGHPGGSRCITVDEKSKVRNHPSDPGKIESHRTDRTRVSEANGDHTITEAAKKYKLTKSSHVQSLEDKKTSLPAVEEGTQRAQRTGRTLGDHRDKNRLPGGLPHGTVPKIGGISETADKNLYTKVDAKKIADGNLSTQGKTKVNEYSDDKKEIIENKINSLDPMRTTDERRVSTVEDALKSVRSMLASINDLGISSELPSKGKLSSPSLDSSIDSPLNPLKQRLPSIEESLSHQDKRRQEKALGKLRPTGRSVSQDSRSPGKDNRARNGFEDKPEKQYTESQKEKRMENEEEKKISDGVAHKRRNETVESVKTSSEMDKDQVKNEEKARPDAENEKKRNGGQLLDSQTLSEEQIKRNQIVESMANARKDRKKKRITQ